ncbi:MAG: Quinonprotein alcohol dehydrogenase [Candidatus Kaiserbacteria bacterium]|nr:Quinonprotein alcohol dehydrogenase [Candidatus Kaiserbacteria bacterium]
MTRDELKQAIRDVVFTTPTDERRIIAPSGKDSSWLFDFRALMLRPDALDSFAEMFWERHKDLYPFQVCAMESAGIALVAAIVMKSVQHKKPVTGLFLRKSRKKDGLMRQIEGTPDTSPVILVDDLINSGSTFEKQMLVLKNAGLTVSRVFTILAFREKKLYRFLEEAHVAVDSIFELPEFGTPFLNRSVREIPARSFLTKWHFSAPGPSHNYVVQKSRPVIDESRIYFGTDAGRFLALDQRTGETVWSFSIAKHPSGKGIFSSPVLHEGTVYFGAYDGNVYALDAATGKLKWAYTDADWVGSSPALNVKKGLLYIGLEFGLLGKRGGICALRISDGSRVWQKDHRELTHSSPLFIAEENMVVIGSNDGTAYAYDAQTGALLWSFSTDGDIKTSFAYDALRRVIVFGSMNGTLYALSVLNGAPVFARETGAGIYSTPLIVKDTVYVASLDKSVYAVDLDTGKDRWTFDTAGRIFAAPAAFEGALWIGSNDGRLYELDLHTGKSISFFQVTERIVNAVAYNEKTRRLFVPTCANEIYCIEKKRDD